MDRSARRSSVREARRQRLGRPVLPLWAALLVAALAGPVLDSAYPSLGIWPLAFVGVALSLLPLIGRGVWSSLLVGFVFGASFYLIHIMWITRYLGPIPWFALGLLEAVFIALGSVLITLAYRWLPRALPGRWARLIVLPILVGGIWTARELFQGSWPYTGFPWARIGMSQSESPLAHLVSWVGVSGLSFLMVAVIAAAMEVVRTRRPLGFRPLSLAPVAVGLILLFAVPQFPTTDAGTMRVGSVQGNGPNGYFDDHTPNAVIQAQLDATAPVLDDHVDLLLWPEGGIDSDPLNNDTTARALTRLSERLDAPLLVNAATARGDDIFNTSMLWDGAAGAVQLHDKRNPVPFGEYVPDREFYAAIVPDLIGLIGREYTPGTNAPYMDVNGVGVGLAICFDVIYDSVIWEGASDGAEVFMFQTNNADFRGTDENLQQLAFARMRALETGRSVVNISTVGTSQVISPSGATLDELPAAEAGAMITDVPLRTGLTPAVLVGSVIQLILFAGSLLGLVTVGIAAKIRRQA
ncbi:apolipoprotein N-acyltransferase [Microbacterium sp. ZW T5_56]|uniref:apolipoprotein N-acyltransferase n=1 Tax=Microbacterium sp. ZW T5_56 TaxID=3378081 RepID=UPI0038521347